MSGSIQHAPFCTIPLGEHTGNEACLVWVEDQPVEMIAPAHYDQGPQGNQVADYDADYRARYGHADPKRAIGHPEIQDRRDNSDPEVVGTEVIASIAAGRASANGHREISQP
jgi:hypothetical protein